jgi:hypothetical protein
VNAKLTTYPIFVNSFGGEVVPEEIFDMVDFLSDFRSHQLMRIASWHITSAANSQ